MVKAYFKNVLYSLLALVPIVLLVMILYWCNVVNFSDKDVTYFLVGFAFMAVGIPTFTYFTEHTVQNMGQEIGQSLAKQKNVVILLILAMLLGFIFTLAEPDLTFLAEQTPFETPVFVIIVAVGVGIMFILGIFRILFNIDLRIVLLIIYAIAFMLCLLVSDGFGAIPIIFDAGGSVTGSVSVPLILAIGIGISSNFKNKKGNETFGLSGIISAGPIIVMAITFIFAKTDAVKDAHNLNIGGYTLEALKNSAIALSPIIAFYFFYAWLFLKKKMKAIFQTLFGFIFIFIGLILFLAGVNIGFLSIGRVIGGSIASHEFGTPIILSFMVIIGFIIAFAEPSIKILSHQIEEVSEGSIKGRTMLVVFGVGISIGLVLSFVRIIYNFSIIYLLVPVYATIFILMFFIDKKYLGIAFDAGAVCSGTIATAFVLPIAIGYSSFVNAGDNKAILGTSFGCLAMVAMVPILMVELVGINSKVQQKIAYNKARKRIKDRNENQVIHF